MDDRDNKNNISISSLATCGVEFVSAIAIGVLIGTWIDKYLDKSPAFLVVFFILGCISGYFNVLRYLEKIHK